MTNPRIRKIADRIQEVVAEMLERRLKDPRLGFVADALPATARHLDEVLARAKAQDEAVAATRGDTYAGGEDPYKKPRVVEDSEEE